MWWGLLIKLATSLFFKWRDKLAAEQALRDMGAATQREDSLRAAEKTEDAAKNAPVPDEDDPRDLRKD